MRNLFSFIRRRAGFTLMEVLIVVVISLSVAAFAVPAYKKMQVKNQFTTAQGLFVDVYNALAMCIDDQVAVAANPANPDLSNCYSSGIQYSYLTNPGDGHPPYLQEYSSQDLKGYKIIVVGSVNANNLRLKLAPISGSPYSATITNGTLSVEQSS